MTFWVILQFPFTRSDRLFINGLNALSSFGRLAVVFFFLVSLLIYPRWGKRAHTHTYAQTHTHTRTIADGRRLHLVKVERGQKEIYLLVDLKETILPGFVLAKNWRWVCKIYNLVNSDQSIVYSSRDVHFCDVVMLYLIMLKLFIKVNIVNRTFYTK